MRIAFVVPAWPPAAMPNGIVTYAAEIIPALRASGHAVHIVPFGEAAGPDDRFTTRLTQFEPKRTNWDRAIGKFWPESVAHGRVTQMICATIRELVWKDQVNIVEIEESFGWSYLLSKQKLLPVVVRLHGPWFLTGGYGERNMSLYQRRREYREGIAMRAADFVSAPTAAVLNAVHSRYGRDIPSAVIPNPIAACDESDRWLLSKCNRNALLFVGRFDRLKGGDLVIRAFAQLAEAFPALSLTFVGADKGLRQGRGASKTLAQFVADNVPPEMRARIVITGPLPRDKVMELRKTHFATVVASEYETFSYGVAEAMSVGSPVVATAVGGIPELIENGRTGILVTPRDASALAAACRDLLESPGHAALLGQAAWEHCRKVYSPERVAAMTVEHYEMAQQAFAKQIGRR